MGGKERGKLQGKGREGALRERKGIEYEMKRKRRIEGEVRDGAWWKRKEENSRGREGNEARGEGKE